MDKPKMSEAKRRANKKWNDANMGVKYDHLHVIIPKGRKKAVEDRAKQEKQTVNGAVNRLLAGYVGLTDDEWKDSANNDE